MEPFTVEVKGTIYTLRSVDKVERFWNRVDKSNPEGCWPWLGYTKKDSGYGGVRWEGTNTTAHNIACRLVHGPPPEPGLVARHSCDNPPCCRPDHLSWGTSQQNAQDSVDRGRRATGLRNGMNTHPEQRSCGERNGMYTHPDKRKGGENYGRLTDEKVAEIVVKYRQPGVSQGLLASEYGVSRSRISQIVRKGAR